MWIDTHQIKVSCKGCKNMKGNIPFFKTPNKFKDLFKFFLKNEKKIGKCQKQEYDFWKLVPTWAFSTIRIHFLFSSTVWLLRFDSLALDELLLNWSKYSNIYIYKKKTYKNKVRIFEFHHDPNLIQWNLEIIYIPSYHYILRKEIVSDADDICKTFLDVR